MPGARLCAYWSQQYRCLYPGTAAPPDAGLQQDAKYVVVEFDDGDSGRIALNDIRFLLSEYPIVGEFLCCDELKVDVYSHSQPANMSHHNLFIAACYRIRCESAA